MLLLFTLNRMVQMIFVLLNYEEMKYGVKWTKLSDVSLTSPGPSSGETYGA